MNENKAYRLDSCEITTCVDSDVAHEALLVSINNAKEKVLTEYPEAKNLNVAFERSQGDTIIKLVFERYEKKEERMDADSEETSVVNVNNGNLKKVLLFIVIVTLIIVGYKCCEPSTQPGFDPSLNYDSLKNVVMKPTDSIEKDKVDTVDVLEPVAVNIKLVEERAEFLVNFYTNVIFGNGSIEELVNNSTPKLLQELKDAYDYECDQGDCYAIWCFRTGYQDGPSDESKVNSVIYLGDNWFKVNYVDMGHVASTKIKFVGVEGILLMDEICFMDADESDGDVENEDVDSLDETSLTSEYDSVDIVGVWRGSTNWGGVIMTETIEFNNDGSGYYKINDDVLPFTWKKKGSSMIEFYSSEGKQELRIDNGRIIDVSANGTNGTVFEKQ